MQAEGGSRPCINNVGSCDEQVVHPTNAPTEQSFERRRRRVGGAPRLAATSAARSLRQRRRRREQPMTQEAARRALVSSTQLHADAAVRIAEAMETMVQVTTRIERILNAAFPTAAEQKNQE